MKFAFISCNNWVRWGGSEELWSRAAAELRRRGHEVLVCVTPWAPPVPQIAELARAGCTIFDLALPHRGPWARVAHALRGFPRTSLHELAARDALAPFAPAVVVISQGNNQDGAAWAETCRRHGLRYALLAQAVSPLFWPADGAFDALRTAYLSAAGAFFVSRQNRDFTQQQIAASLPRAELVCNPFAVAYDQAPMWPESPDEFRLAQVARLEPGAKGQDVLLAVLAQEKWRARPLRVAFFGGGACGRVVRELAAYHRLANVEFPGHVDDIAALWRAHHALVLPSRMEGMPLALIEAALCHRPAIVTDAGGSAELVADGETGFIAGDATVAALDAALERAWAARARWRELGLAAGRHVRSLVPRDPAAAFADRLVALVSSAAPPAAARA